MSSFSVGDKVRLAETIGRRKMGSIGEVVRVTTAGPGVITWPYEVMFDGNDEDTEIYSELELELVDDEDGPDGSVEITGWNGTVRRYATPNGDDLILDPTDPFEQVLISMVQTNRKKRADYAIDGSPWSNFEFTASVLDIQPEDAAIHNVAQKLARLQSLRANGRTKQTANEAVADTYLDLAVYAVIALAIKTHPTGKVEQESEPAPGR